MHDLLEPVQISTISAPRETDLVAMIKTGDQVACTRLVRLFGPRMMFVARLVPCARKTIATMCFKMPSYQRSEPWSVLESNSRLSTWLHRIVVNSCLMKLRRWFVSP